MVNDVYICYNCNYKKRQIHDGWFSRLDFVRQSITVTSDTNNSKVGSEMQLTVHRILE